MPLKRLWRRDYTIGWICTSSIELEAALNMLDEVYQNPYLEDVGVSSYSFGRIGTHDVVFVCLRGNVFGASHASQVTSQIKREFPSIRFCLIVGVATAAPSADTDIRLGDVVITIPTPQQEGVVEYGVGKTRPDRRPLYVGSLYVQPSILWTTLTKFRSNYERQRIKLSEHLNFTKRQAKFAYPGAEYDDIKFGTYNHVRVSHIGSTFSQPVTRIPRSNDDIVLFFGTTAPINRTERDGSLRVRLNSKVAESLGLDRVAGDFAIEFPCVVIRGISDYARSYTYPGCQPYASATAAACAKEFLRMISKVDATELVHTDNSGSTISVGPRFGSESAFRDSAYGSTESVQAYGTAADEFVALLINDNILSNAFETIVNRLGTEIFEKTFSGTLGTYFKELERVAKKEIEHGAVYILRRRVAYISQEIRHLYADDYADNNEDIDVFRQLAPDKSIQLNKWLEKKYGEPMDDTGPDTLGEEEEDDAVIALLDPEQQLRSLQQVREFLISRQPFLNLREACCQIMSDFGPPTHLVCVVRAVVALEAWKTRYLHRYDVPNDQSVISLGPGLKRIRWKCVCGYQFQEDVFEHKLNAAANFVQAIDQGHLKTVKFPLHGYAMIEYLFRQAQTLFSWHSSMGELPLHNMPALPAVPRGNNVNPSQPSTSEGDQSASTDAALVVDNTFICFGINQLSGGPYLYHDESVTALELEATQPSTNEQSDVTDREMFLSLQAHYYAKRPWWSRMISCVELSEVKYYEFQLYLNPNNEIEINDDWYDRLPTEKTKPPPDQVWIYNPQERDITPFLSTKALTHYVNYPNHCNTGRFWWDRIPKKKGAELTCTGAKPQPGWGLIFKEAWAFKWYLALWLPFVFLSLLTAILVVHYSHSPWGTTLTFMSGVMAFISWAWNVQQVKLKQKGIS